jgi:hypothetical protein
MLPKENNNPWSLANWRNPPVLVTLDSDKMYPRGLNFVCYRNYIIDCKYIK